MNLQGSKHAFMMAHCFVVKITIARYVLNHNKYPTEAIQILYKYEYIQ